MSLISRHKVSSQHSRLVCEFPCVFESKEGRLAAIEISYSLWSSIWDHINKSGHAASVEDFSVLDRANNDFNLLIHESLLILRDRPSLNSQQSSIPLALF